MEIIPMGTTHLPVEVILEYLESLKEIYTMEVGFLGLKEGIAVRRLTFCT